METMETLSVSKGSTVLETVEMHTGGDPVRIAVKGYPALPGDGVLKKMHYARDNLDHYRTTLIHEPRGHYDMYGAVVMKSDSNEADMSGFFIHKDGYSAMCGHATIALGRYAVDFGYVKPVAPETTVRLQYPCGLVETVVEYNAETGKTGNVRFTSVPSFAFAIDQQVDVGGLGVVNYDIGYGGSFFAIVNAQQLKLDISTTPIATLCDVGNRICTAIKSRTKFTHHESSELAYLTGAVLVDGPDTVDCTRNITVCGAQQACRAPCGVGVTARLAVQFHKGHIKSGEKRSFYNAKTGSEFQARVVSSHPFGGYDKAVLVEVGGHAYYTGRSQFWTDEKDPLTHGFVIK